MTKLTDITIRKLQPPERGQKTYFEGEGFGIRISQGGTKTFVQMYGKERKLLTIGRYPAMSLKTARQQAKLALLTPQSSKPSNSLSEARTAFLARCEDACRPSTTAMYRHFLNQLTGKTLEDVTKDQVTHSPHAIASTKAFFNWCIKEGLTERNPVRYEQAKTKQRTRLLTDDEIKLIWSYDHPPFSDHLKILILTGQRKNQYSSYEVRGETIFFPSEIMKGKEDHTIPLLPEAKRVLERLKPHNGWSKQKARIDKTVPLPHWVIHDIRRYFSTTMAKLRVPLHVTERILAHRSGQVSGVAAIYNRHDFMEEAVEALAKYEHYLIAVVKS